jgi:hypothetical protein
MSLPPETQLLLVAAFFFIYDAAHLLFDNEVVLTPTGGSWTYRSGKHSLTLRGKKLFISNLLLLHRPEYRFHWDYEKQSVKEVSYLPKKLAHHLLLSITAYGSWVSIFLALPFLLHYYRIDAALLACAAVIYSFSLLGGLVVINKHNDLGLTSKQSRVMALEFFFCPPFTPNIIRRITHSGGSYSNLIPTAKSHLPQEQWELLRNEIAEQINFEIDEAEDNPDKQKRLTDSRSRLLGEHKP